MFTLSCCGGLLQETISQSPLHHDILKGLDLAGWRRGHHICQMSSVSVLESMWHNACADVHFSGSATFHLKSW